MTLLIPLNNTSLLTPYEQFFIQTFHKSGSLISEQNSGEPNPLLQMAINPAHTPTWPSLLNSNLHSAHTLQCNAPQLQPATSSTTRHVSYSHIYLHPLYQPAHHWQAPTLVAPSNTCTKHQLPICLTWLNARIRYQPSATTYPATHLYPRNPNLFYYTLPH